MLINNWYVAGLSGEVTREVPFRVKMLSLDFVLFRDQDGVAHCLSDVCCHRGGALGRGKVNDGCVACPYHGWEFDSAGQCTKIPALGDDARIPKRARIDSYPVQEKYGWVWVFLGDLAEEERPDIPVWFDEFYGTDGWHNTSYVYEWNDVNWVRLGENSVDSAHPSFVHKAFGSFINPKVNIVPIEDTDFGARVDRSRTAPQHKQKTGSIAKILPKDRKKTRVEIEFSMIGVTEILKQHMATGVTQILFSARTPIDEYNTRSFGLQARNFLTDAKYDEERFEKIFEAIHEDLEIVSHIKPKLTPSALSEEFLIEADGMELSFRKKVRELAQRGWEIDTELLQSEGRRKVFVIPSPDRKIDPKGWIHSPVPLKDGSNSIAEAAE